MNHKAAACVASDHKGAVSVGKPMRRKRGGGRGRGERKTANNSNNSNVPKNKGPPQSPTLKVTIRRVQNAEKFGSVAALADGLLRVLIERANERLLLLLASSSSCEQIYLDGNSVKREIRAERAVQAAREVFEKEQTSESAGGVAAASEATDRNVEEQEETGRINLPGKREEEQKQADANVVVEGMERLQIDDDDAVPKGMISARVLYMVAPKKTRRRGEKPGRVYLILTAPPIEVLPSPAARTSDEEKPVAAPEFSRDFAQRKIGLSAALEALVQCAQDDAKARQDLANCDVEESPSAKTWRGGGGGHHRDRFEGTIQDSPDFKAFMETRLTAKKDLLGRPKPTPGGGSGSAVAEGTNAQPVAALVLHLQKKREEEKKYKQKPIKKKPKEQGTKKGGGTKVAADALAKQEKRKRYRKKREGLIAKKAGS
jgi:hypothetical protein